MGNVKVQLAKLFEASLKVTVPNEPDVEPLVAACTGKFGDYQWYCISSFIATIHMPKMVFLFRYEMTGYLSFELRSKFN